MKYKQNYYLLSSKKKKISVIKNEKITKKNENKKLDERIKLYEDKTIIQCKQIKITPNLIVYL